MIQHFNSFSVTAPADRGFGGGFFGFLLLFGIFGVLLGFFLLLFTQAL